MERSGSTPTHRKDPVMKTHRKLRLTQGECIEIITALDLLKDIIEEYGDDDADERLLIISDLLARLR